MIRIVTDTSADITVSQAREMNVELVPLHIHFENKSYNPLQDETFQIFYQMLEEAKTLPSTSQPDPQSFLSIYESAKHAGDDVVVITLSNKVSGTFQSATLAKDLCDYDRIYVVDSLSAVIGQRLLIDFAVRKRAEGMDAPTIAQMVKEAANHVVLFAGLDTLKYLRKGGRIPKSMEMIGTVIGLKPLIKLTDGAIVMAGKARGRLGSIHALLNLIVREKAINAKEMVYFGYTKSNEQCKILQEKAIEKFNLLKTVCYPVGSVVGTHVGPGAFVIAYLPNFNGSVKNA